MASFWRDHPWRLRLAVLLAAALAVLAWEFIALVRWIWRGRKGLAAWAITLSAVVAAPLALLGAGLHLATASPAHSRKPIRACGRIFAGGTILQALVAITILWMPIGPIIALAVGASLWSLRSYRSGTQSIDPRTRRRLLAIRIAIITILCLWAALPIVEYRRSIKTAGKVLIGVDVSRSMDQRDVLSDGRAAPADVAIEPSSCIARIDAVSSVIAENRPAFRNFADDLELDLFTFAASAGIAEDIFDRDGLWPPQFASTDGQATAIGDSLHKAYDRQSATDSEVVCMIVISDGINNTAGVISPDKLASLLGARGVPVHTVLVGADYPVGSTGQLSLRNLDAADQVSAFNSMPIAVTVRGLGLEASKVRIQCFFDDEQIASETVDIDSARFGRILRFQHTPLVSGFHRLSVVAEPLTVKPATGDSQTPTRQSISKLVHVVDSGHRILFVEGRFRPEGKYIAAAIASDSRFSLDRRIILHQPRPGEEPPIGEDLSDWIGYHAIIFGDIAASRFTDKQLRIVRELVDKYGKGFCLAGGDAGFVHGGWENTSIAEILPVDIKLSNSSRNRPVQVTPTAAGLASESMNIGKPGQPVADVWASLPPLAGANLLGGVKPLAGVLATTEDAQPLIVAQPFGKGRTMAIGLDTTWQWVLTPTDTDELQRRFWRQVALYLAAPQGNIWITTDRTSYDADALATGTESIDVSAGLEDPSGAPVADVPVKTVMTAPDGEQTAIELTRDGAARRGRIAPPDAVGLYTLRIDAEMSGKPMTAEHKFEIVRRDIESQDILADTAMMERIAADSGGKFVTLEKLPELLDGLKYSTKPKDVYVTQTADLAGAIRWPAILVILALLCLEWSLRKRASLV